MRLAAFDPAITLSRVHGLTDRNYFMIAVAVYGLSTLYSIFLWRKGFRRDDRINYAVLFLGFAFHTTAMVKRGFTLSRCPVNNLYEAITFIVWAITLAYLVIGLWPRMRFLGAFGAPVLLAVGAFALLPAFDPPHEGKHDFRTDWGSLHAGFILLACGCFGLAAVAGAMYLTQAHNLKFNKVRAIMAFLPSIERLEHVIMGLLVGGFCLMTSGLALSPLLMKQKYGAYFRPDPIGLYSVFLWALYLGLLVMRWRMGQGGRRLAWGAVGAFAFILLTFWGFILLSPAHN